MAARSGTDQKAANSTTTEGPPSKDGWHRYGTASSKCHMRLFKALLADARERRELCNVPRKALDREQLRTLVQQDIYPHISI